MEHDGVRFVVHRGCALRGAFIECAPSCMARVRVEARLLLVHRIAVDHLQADVGPVDRASHLHGVAQPEDALDVVAHALGGRRAADVPRPPAAVQRRRGGAAEAAGAVGPLGATESAEANLEVRRPKVVAPLRDAVGLVDDHCAHEAARAERAQRVLQRRRQQAFWRHVKQPCVWLVRFEVAQEGFLALSVHCARPELRADVAVVQVVQLVLGQREQRRQHDGHSCHPSRSTVGTLVLTAEHECWRRGRRMGRSAERGPGSKGSSLAKTRGRGQLEADRLAEACREHDQAVTAVERGLHCGDLLRLEAIKAPVPLERGQQVCEGECRRRGGRERGRRGLAHGGGNDRGNLMKFGARKEGVLRNREGRTPGDKPALFALRLVQTRQEDCPSPQTQKRHSRQHGRQASQEEQEAAHLRRGVVVVARPVGRHTCCFCHDTSGRDAGGRPTLAGRGRTGCADGGVAAAPRVHGVPQLP
eukprot:scaffold78688_cov66-Phaeocystis_antarctica.AAC.4